MPTHLETLREDLYAQMETHGWNREEDKELFEYAERWSFSNQFMDVSSKALFDLFVDSYGVSTYNKFGFVPDDDE